MRPHFNAAVKELYNDGIRVGAINGPKNKSLMRKYKVSGYPVQIAFYRGKPCGKIYAR